MEVEEYKEIVNRINAYADAVSSTAKESLDYFEKYEGETLEIVTITAVMQSVLEIVKKCGDVEGIAEIDRLNAALKYMKVQILEMDL